MRKDVLRFAGKRVVDVHEFPLDKVGCIRESVGPFVVRKGASDGFPAFKLFLEQIRLVQEENDRCLSKPL